MIAHTNIKKTIPLVSVYMTTYNQEAYIGQAIESIVAQECSFSFELIIGEDGSTDNTRAIVEKYAMKYPDIIIAILRDKNIGAAQNSKEVMERCQGKYLAFCEGDDYWIGTNRLQKQIDLIQSDENYRAVFTHVKWVDKDNNEIGHSERENGPIDYRKLLQVNPIHTCAFLMDRSIETPSMMKIMHKAPYTDYVMFLAAGFYGKIAYIDETLAAYRRDVGGMHRWTASESSLQRLKILDLFLEDKEFKKMSFYIKIAKQYLCIHLSRHLSDEKRFLISMKYFGLGLYFTLYVLFAKKEETYRHINRSELLKIGFFSLPYTKVFYLKFKRLFVS
ncbi:MAG: hypothetical protein COA44_00630 [Arcobacter sp.]|nr:MAG: hypothetical protein COA44_00630 [Arcobacter sp.]